jgi:tellurite resistance protein
MLNKLQSFLNITHHQESKQHENEAIIELMMMTMFIDKSLKLSEHDAIEKYAKSLNWKSPISFEYYLNSATAKVRNALSTEEKKKNFLKDINSRITSPETKNKVLQTCQDLAGGDGELSPKEKEFLQLVAEFLV